MYRKVITNVISRTRHRRKHGDGPNDISIVKGQYPLWCLQRLRRAMSLADIHILNFCVGFSTGRYIHIWNLLQETRTDGKGEVWKRN